MKNILVTGISRGIGKAAAETLIKEGYFVHGVYNTNENEALQMKKELENLEIYQCNFSDRENTLRLISDLHNVELHGIVNCAGVFVDIDFDAFEMSDWEKTFEVNLHAPLLLIDGLKGNIQKGGSIVNITSTDAFTGAISGLAYSASKAALTNLSMSMANILSSKGIRTNNIAPGWIGDGMQSPQELLDEAKSFNPLGRLGDYKDIANIVSFLLSDKSAFVNGTTITADGGDSATNYLLKMESEL